MRLQKKDLPAKNKGQRPCQSASFAVVEEGVEEDMAAGEDGEDAVAEEGKAEDAVAEEDGRRLGIVAPNYVYYSARANHMYHANEREIADIYLRSCEIS